MGTDPNTLKHARMQPAIVPALPAACMPDEARLRSTEALRITAAQEGDSMNISATEPPTPSVPSGSLAVQGSNAPLFILPHTRTSDRSGIRISRVKGALKRRPIAITMLDTETGTESGLPSALEVASRGESDISLRIVHELVSELVTAVAADDEEEETAKPAIDARQHKYSR